MARVKDADDGVTSPIRDRTMTIEVSLCPSIPCHALCAVLSAYYIDTGWRLVQVL